jgi:hypothetical protein
VLLDLALWKVSCQLRPPAVVVHAPEWMEWLSRGWKALKDGADVGGDSLSRCDAPLMGITSLVAPFLGLKREGGH